MLAVIWVNFDWIIKYPFAANLIKSIFQRGFMRILKSVDSPLIQRPYLTKLHVAQDQALRSIFDPAPCSTFVQAPCSTFVQAPCMHGAQRRRRDFCVFSAPGPVFSSKTILEIISAAMRVETSMKALFPSIPVSLLFTPGWKKPLLYAILAEIGNLVAPRPLVWSM